MMRGAIACFVVVAVAGVARPNTARADLAGSLYEDVRDVVEELIESEITTSVKTTIEVRAPVVAAYFHGTLERLASPSWAGLATSMRQDLDTVVGDFVYWHLATGKIEGDIVASAHQFFGCAVGNGPGCEAIHAVVVGRGRSLLDAECRSVEPPPERRVACDLGLAVRAALEQRGEARRHVLDAIADLLLGHLKDPALARRLRDVLIAWLENPAALPPELTDLIASPDALKGLSGDALTALCGNRAAMKEYLRDPDRAPGWACFAVSAPTLPKVLQVDLAITPPSGPPMKETLSFWQVEQVLDAIPTDDWGDHNVYAALVDAAVERHCRGRTGGGWPCADAPLAGGTQVVVTWFDTALPAKVKDGKIRGEAPKEMARWSKRFQRVTQQVAKVRAALPATLQGLLFVRDTGAADAPAVLRAVAQMSRLAARLQSRWYLLARDARDQGDLSSLDIVALVELARDTLRESGTDLAADAQVIGRIRGDHARELGDWLRLAVRADYRGLGSETLRAAFAQGNARTTHPHETFFIALAAYLLESPDDNTQDVTRSAFRAAAKDLLLSANRQGVPRASDRVHARLLPRIGVRVALNDEFAVTPDGRSRRWVVAADWPTLMLAFTDNVGLEASVLDPIAPLAELALRPGGRYSDEKWIALDAVRPRAGLWLAVPELSRRLAFELGAGARLVGVDVMSVPDAPLEARYVRRTSLLIDVGLQLVF